MTEITAVSTYFITFFDTFGIDLTHWKWLIELCFLVSLVSINLIAVKVFGEVEFWFSMIKITLICAMIATAVVMIVIGYHYPAVQIHAWTREPGRPRRIRQPVRQLLVRAERLDGLPHELPDGVLRL